MDIIKKSKKSVWESAGAVFQEDRIVRVPVDALRKCNLQSKLPYVPDVKEKRLINNIIQEQVRTLLYSLDMVLQKLEYVEKVGTLKFENEDAGKNYCFAVLHSQPTWGTGFSLYGNDWGQAGVACESFPYEADGVEKLFWDDGLIIQYQRSVHDLEHGVVVDRKVIWKAVRAIFERNKALLEWKLNRMLIKNRIKEV